MRRATFRAGETFTYTFGVEGARRFVGPAGAGFCPPAGAGGVRPRSAAEEARPGGGRKLFQLPTSDPAARPPATRQPAATRGVQPRYGPLRHPAPRSAPRGARPRQQPRPAAPTRRRPVLRPRPGQRRLQPCSRWMCTATCAATPTGSSSGWWAWPVSAGGGRGGRRSFGDCWFLVAGSFRYGNYTGQASYFSH